MCVSLHTASRRTHINTKIFSMIRDLDISPSRYFLTQPGPNCSAIDRIRNMHCQNHNASWASLDGINTVCFPDPDPIHIYAT